VSDDPTSGTTGPLFDPEAARAHLTFLFGDAAQPCVVALAFAWDWDPAEKRHRPGAFRQSFFSWPDELDAAVTSAEAAVGRGHDVYVCPHPRTERKRRKRTGAEHGALLWADLDGDAPDASVRRVRDAGAVLVDSGSPGHFHAYLRLAGTATRDQVETMNNQLATALGADAKWSNESLLRLAGTRNFKSGGDGRPVEFVVPPEKAGTFGLDELRPLLGGGKEASKGKPGADRSEQAWAVINQRLRDEWNDDGIVLWFTGTDEGRALFGHYKGEDHLRADIVRAREKAAEEPEDEKPRKALAVRMFERVRAEHYTFLADDAREYALHTSGERVAEQITSGFVMRACQDFGLTAGYPTAADTAARMLRAMCEESSRLVLNLRCARWGEHGLVLDLGQPGNARCVVVTWEGWQVRDAPPEGVYFRRSSASRPLPDPVRGEEGTDGHALLRELLGMPPEDHRWPLVRGWLTAALLPDIPRPLLIFLGPSGSAKTTRAWMTVSIVDPKPDGKLGGSFGKSVEDDQVKALSHYAVAYDNLGSVSEAVSDHLARLVTGESGERRRLYTDDELAAIHYRRTGVFTAINLPKVQPDALARLVALDCSWLPATDRQAERRLWLRWHEAHPQMLAAVLDDVVTMLRQLPAVQADEALLLPRMADYFQAVHAVHPALGEAYREASEAVLRVAAEGDPFVQTLCAWLAEVGGRFEGTPTEVWDAAGGYRWKVGADISEFGTGTGWWPRSARAFGHALTRADGPLRVSGVTVERPPRSTSRNLVLLYKPPS
jgi:hypothetical protein